MERKLGFFGGVICILTITVLVLARVEAAKVEEFDYYKTSVIWPPSFCNDVQNDCVNGILDYFTLHGLIPMYSNHRAVPPYDLGKRGFYSKCTDEIPMTKEEVEIKIESFDKKLLLDMTKYMPNLKNPKNYAANKWLWLNEWEKHGMCFTNPTDPRVYYETALIVPKHMDLVNILEEEGEIVPSNEGPYNIATIARIVSAYVTKRVKIHCNKDENGRLQLFEVEICFEKTGVVKDCPNEFYLCEGDYVWFPSA